MFTLPLHLFNVRQEAINVLLRLARDTSIAAAPMSEARALRICEGRVISSYTIEGSRVPLWQARTSFGFLHHNDGHHTVCTHRHIDINYWDLSQTYLNTHTWSLECKRNKWSSQVETKSETLAWTYRGCNLFYLTRPKKGWFKFGLGTGCNSSCRGVCKHAYLYVLVCWDSKFPLP